MASQQTEKPARPYKRRCCCCCLLPFLTGLALLMLLLLPPAAPPMPSPEEQARIRARLQDLEREMQAIRLDAEARRPHPFTIRLTEQEMNTFLATDNQAGRILRQNRIDRAFVRIEAGRVKITAQGLVRELPIAVTAVLVPELRPDRTIGFEIESLQAGRLGVPESLSPGLARAVARALEAQELHPGVGFDSVRVEDGAILLTGNTR